MVLSSLVEIRSGFPFRSGIVGTPEGTTPVIQIKDLEKRRGVKTTGLTYVNFDRDVAPFVVRAGDILLQARGERADATPVREIPNNAIAASQLFILTPRLEVLPEYLAWFLNSPRTQERIKKGQRGSYIPLLPKEALEGIDVPVPPLEVQRQIVGLVALRAKEEALLARQQDLQGQLINLVCVRAAIGRVQVNHESEGGHNG